MGSSPLNEMRRICLGLPETAETMTWGQPHFRVRGKIFAGFGDHRGIANIGFKLEREHADAVIQDPRFYRAPYVGAHGWVSMRVEGVRDWKDGRAPDVAHQTPEVMAIWEPMGPVLANLEIRALRPL